MIDVLVFVFIISVLIFFYNRSGLHKKIEELSEANAKLNREAIAANSLASDIMASQASRDEQLLNEKQRLTDRANKRALAVIAAKIKIDKLNAQLKQERAKSKDKLEQERAKSKDKLEQERAKSKDKLEQERAKILAKSNAKIEQLKEKEAGYKGQIKALNKEVKKFKASIK